jgi:hypothetical protein
LSAGEGRGTVWLGSAEWAYGRALNGLFHSQIATLTSLAELLIACQFEALITLSCSSYLPGNKTGEGSNACQDSGHRDVCPAGHGGPCLRKGCQRFVPLTIVDQGSFAVGGAVKVETGTFDPRKPRSCGQSYHGDHASVFYQVPQHARHLPVVMLHGAGQSARTHFLFSDLNNRQIADLVLTFLSDKQLDR